MTLKPGCYLMSFKPSNSSEAFVGTFRVTGTESKPRKSSKPRQGSKPRQEPRPRFSGDLYQQNDGIHELLTQPFNELVPVIPGAWQARALDKDPSVPLFPLQDYRYHLEVFAATPAGNAVVLDLRAHKFDPATRTLVPGEVLQLRLSPRAERGKPTWLGPLLSGSQERGEVFLQWLGEDLRRARLRIISIQPDSADKIQTPRGSDGKEVPTWEVVFQRMGWQLTVLPSERPVSDFTRLNGRAWTPYDLGSAALRLREELVAAEDDDGWVYDLLCVSRFENEQFLGLMFDTEATDLNERPRESAAVAALQEWTLDGKKSVSQKLFKGHLYYRTAVHEVGHAMNLTHNLRSNTFMNVTESLLFSSSKANSARPKGVRTLTEFKPEWCFSEEEVDWLQHGPDIAIRPGGLSRRAVHLRSGEEIPAVPALSLRNQPEILLAINPIRASFPLGAPIRLNYRLSRHGWTGKMPADISLRSSFVMGRVIGPDRRTRLFRSAFRCCDSAHAQERLSETGSPEGSMTLLRGIDGPLFPVPGAYHIELEVRWDADGQTNRVVGRTDALVNAAASPQEAAAAATIQNEPALMPALVQGLLNSTAVRALSVALQSEILAPHYLATALRCFAMGTKRRVEWEKLFTEAASRNEAGAGSWHPPMATLRANLVDKPGTDFALVSTRWEYQQVEQFLATGKPERGKQIIKKLTHNQVTLAPETLVWLEEVLALTGGKRQPAGRPSLKEPELRWSNTKSTTPNKP